MKKIFAIVLTVAMLLSLGAVMASAAGLDVNWTEGKYAVADPSEFSPVGTIKIQWDAEAADKLDLADGNMDDWQAAGYTTKVIDASNMVSWVGGTDGAIDAGMPANWDITTYFVADAEWLYIGFYVTDPVFVYGTEAAAYNGDAFQMCLDFGGKVGEAVRNGDENLANPKNIFYSFACLADGAPIQIALQEAGYDKEVPILSEENGNGVKGTSGKTETGWYAEFALSWTQMYSDYEYKAWVEDTEIYVGGSENRPLTIGCALYYLNRSETAGSPEWAAGTSNGVLIDPNTKEMVEAGGVPGVSWTCYDNGIQLELDITEGVSFNEDGIVILDENDDIPTEGDVDEPTDPETVPETDPETVPETDPVTEAPTAAPTDDAGDDTGADEGCASVIGFGAVAVLAAAAAVVALKKKD